MCYVFVLFFTFPAEFNIAPVSTLKIDTIFNHLDTYMQVVFTPLETLILYAF